ncbi:hypothetical protein [Desulfonema magnum]|uniref:Uncharacterized protein n=1 Tax=Desulfonema magnum TaxID=45655 RepID=A0A975BUM9_9BACT|nr:hypothetical protein [Desulfonema magnum]QTA92059.1 Uncharacterized protein dnm_081330 [Desulfonema magnum]
MVLHGVKAANLYQKPCPADQCQDISSQRSARTVNLYQKPYSLPDARALMDHARKLVNAGIPNTRLKRFGYAPSLGKINGTLECLKLYTRTGKDQRPIIWNALDHFDCMSNIPWKEVAQKDKDNAQADTTMLADMIELTGFIRKD